MFTKILIILFIVTEVLLPYISVTVKKAQEMTATVLSATILQKTNLRPLSSFFLST
jgi:hypothetical protein